MRSCLVTLVVSLSVLTGGCPNGPVVESEGIFLAPRIWAQFGCDGETSGFNAVHTALALEPLKAWSASVGELSSGGPVIGIDGTIYVGNLAGELVALNSSGVERWRRKLDHSIFSSPATDVETGEIFVVGQGQPGSDGVPSRIFRLDSGGGLLAVSQEPLASAGSVKLWGDFLFLLEGSELLAFEKSTLTLVSRQSVNCINLICGDVPLSFEVQFAICMATFVTSELAGVTDECFESYRSPGNLPGLSIVDSPALIGDSEQPLVVVTTGQCAIAFRFHPAGDAPRPFNPHFEVLWSRLLVEEECDAETARTTAPAVILAGQVVFGVNNSVLSLDLFTGEELWRRDIGSDLVHPPLAALRQIYLTTDDDRFVILDSDGDLLSETPLKGSGAAAMSLDHVFVASTEGMHTLSLDPADGFSFDSSIASEGHIGIAIPALGEDGTVYVATPDGFVHAYASSGVLQKPARVPQVDWELSEGTQLTAAESIELSAVVSGLDGGAFSGTVEFASDIDGVLCQALAVNGRAACAPARPLSRGTHQLSAFALDESGGANLAPLTIEVLNREPTVEILTPELGSIIDETIEFTFVARVADAEETISDERVRWSSDLVGELGFGATMTRSMPVGVHTVTVVVTDSSGATAQDSVVLEVTGADSSEVGLGTAGGTSQGENAAPTVEIMTPELGSIIDESIEFTFVARVADAEDVEIADQQVRWSSDLVGELGVGATMTRTMPVGVHTVTVVVTDSSGATAQDSVVLEVIGAIP